MRESAEDKEMFVPQQPVLDPIRLQSPILIETEHSSPTKNAAVNPIDQYSQIETKQH